MEQSVSFNKFTAPISFLEDKGVFHLNQFSIEEWMRSVFKGGNPFPHIVLDDFLPDKTIQYVKRNFPEREAASESFNRSQERLKLSFDPNGLVDDKLRNLFYIFNSAPFISFVEDLTGIKGLIGDPYFEGGGFHETLNRGKLGVHADFNLHKRLSLKRRINIIIYLNEHWLDSYEGHLELWNKQMSDCVHKISPIYNRAVIFETNEDSFHGHPEPLNTPNGLTRRSIALYYYTASRLIYDEFKVRTTNFKVRKNSSDKFDLRTKVWELMNDMLPPLFYRMIKKLKKIFLG